RRASAHRERPFRGRQVRFAVVGGGIAGLSAAWELAGTDGAEVTVYEPGHLGGKLLTTTFLGRAVDEGADSLITRVPEGIALCQELGLGEEMGGPEARRAMLFARGKSRPFPDGLVLGAPARLLPLARSRILSVGGMGRASLDLVLPRTDLGSDVSVWSLIASRFGPEVAERLVEPLLGSIHAGSTKKLSAAATAPQILAAARANRSLLLGLRAMGRSQQSAGDGENSASGGPLFVAPRGGMQVLVDRLVQRLRGAGVAIVPSAASALRRDGRSVVVEPAGERYDGVVLAVPAPVASTLLQQLLGPGARSRLAGIVSASVAVVTFGFGDGSLEVPRDLSGVLVAPGGGLLMTACSFGSNKWPHWAAPGRFVIRASVGRDGDGRWSALTDEDLVGKLCEELGTVLGQPTPTPVAGGWRVSRWPAALPQYEVGHLERIDALKATLSREAPTVALAGSSYSGAGVPACIGSGRRSAAEILAAVQVLGEPAA
ncbi:MAG TPA: protoporphyrinogen oxidase, partial [Acidimicrobiales bacterium]|nr:protoporphyrinogen oxidase [Acidimicrobiales bacterium]